MNCPQCLKPFIEESIGFVKGDPAVIERCENNHRYGRVFPNPSYQFLSSVERAAKREEYTGSLKSYGYFGDHVSTWKKK